MMQPLYMNKYQAAFFYGGKFVTCAVFAPSKVEAKQTIEGIGGTAVEITV